MDKSNGDGASPRIGRCIRLWMRGLYNCRTAFREHLLKLRQLGANFSTAVATPYVGGALIAVCCCWAGVILYFFPTL